MRQSLCDFVSCSGDRKTAACAAGLKASARVRQTFLSTTQKEHGKKTNEQKFTFRMANISPQYCPLSMEMLPAFHRAIRYPGSKYQVQSIVSRLTEEPEFRLRLK
jgi:hypothetical protein